MLRHLSSQHDAYLQALIEVLLLHPAGLRRWSVMREIRIRCERSVGEVSMKLEDDVERLFRKFCVEISTVGDRSGAPDAEDALFYRPAERAGEVWAVNRARASAWLANSAETRSAN